MRKYLIIILLLGILGWGIFAPRSLVIKDPVFFKVEKGDSFGEIAANLESQGLIRWAKFFQIYVLGTGKAHKLQAGGYLFSPSMSVFTIAKKLSSGDIATMRITVPEGFTSFQIAERLRDETGSDPVSLEKYEGYLFPDTYEIAYGASAEEIAKIMSDNFNKKTAGLKIVPEVVVMASLLEKELITKEDKKIASGILWKRLRALMPLQVDAHMWTYENYGLPKKPIANPGLDSILAAIYPESSPYWYYLSKPDGTTVFSRTLEEHNTAKAKYLFR